MKRDSVASDLRNTTPGGAVEDLLPAAQRRLSDDRIPRVRSHRLQTFPKPTAAHGGHVTKRHIVSGPALSK